MILVAAVTLVVDSIANALLIPHLGMRGAALSTAATLTLAAIALVLARRWVPIPPTHQVPRHESSP